MERGEGPILALQGRRWSARMLAEGVVNPLALMVVVLSGALLGWSLAPG